MKLLSLGLLHLSHTTHFQQNMTQKFPNKLPLLFCRVCKTFCFYKLLHQPCCFDSLRTIWSEALEIEVDIETIRQVNRSYIESPQNFEWSDNLEPSLFLQASCGSCETSEIYYTKLLLILKFDLYPKHNASGYLPWDEMSYSRGIYTALCDRCSVLHVTECNLLGKEKEANECDPSDQVLCSTLCGSLLFIKKGQKIESACFCNRP